MFAVLLVAALGTADSAENVTAPLRAAVIGAGFSGLTAALELNKLGYDVTVYEKHAAVGGRAQVFTTPEGFEFDMGPSWYWMPGIFDHIFERYGRAVNEFYNLTLLDPAYRIELPEGLRVDVPGTKEGLIAMARERGGDDDALSLELFFAEAHDKFQKGVYEFIWKPMTSWLELLDFDLMRSAFELDMFSGFSGHLRKFTVDPLMHLILKWPVIFIGADPSDAAAMYSLMTYAGHIRGTWYPDGGLSAPAVALAEIARDAGVKFAMESEVTSFQFDGADPTAVSAICTAAQPATAATDPDGNTTTTGGSPAACHEVDAVIAAADYHHVEQRLLPERFRTYDASFWDRQILSPSTLLYYLGFDKSLPGLMHHTFFFEEDLDNHLQHVFAHRPPGGDYASNPTFYLSATSKTDPNVAPAGGESVFVLVPIHHRLNGSDTAEVRASVLDLVLDRVQARMDHHCSGSSDSNITAEEAKLCGASLKESLVYDRSYGPSDFETDHYAFRGNAFGLANVLTQSLVLKPTLDAKPSNMMFAGHLTNPGPGVPPALVSGVVSAGALHAKLAARGEPEVWERTAFNFVLWAIDLFALASMGSTLCWIFTVGAVALLVVIPTVEVVAASFLSWLLPPLKPSPFKSFRTSSAHEATLRFRSYLVSTEKLYRHGRTYFAASTLMAPQCFLHTAGMYALFRVADDFVDNDDERLRAAEQDGAGRISPGRFAEGAKKRGELLGKFIADFWKCRNAAVRTHAAALAAGTPGAADAADADADADGMTIAEMYALHPVLPAVIEASIESEFEDDLFHRFFNAMSMDARTSTPVAKTDLEGVRNKQPSHNLADKEFVYVGNVCRTKGELFKYMDGSAAVIGDFMVPLLITLPKKADFNGDDAAYMAAREGVLAHRRRAMPHARNLGNAFQMTNFIRDIHEDTTIARQYVPTDMCAKHGIFGKVLPPTDSKLADSANGVEKVIVGFPMAFVDHIADGAAVSEGLYDHPGFKPLMEEMIDLAEELYVDADKGVEMLPSQVRHVIAVARHAYSAIHHKIRDGDYRIYETRFRVPLSGKLKAAASVITSSQLMWILAVEFVFRGFWAAVDNSRRLHAASSRYAVPLLLTIATFALTSPVDGVGAVAEGAISPMWSLLTTHLSLDKWVLAASGSAAAGAANTNATATAATFLQGLAECSYFDFHLIFTVPAAIAAWSGGAAVAASSAGGSTDGAGKRAFACGATAFWTVVLCCVATVYTLPWDDMLVATKVWGYGDGRVLTEYLVGHTPAEEVFFFTIQTVLVGALWFLWFQSTADGEYGLATLVPPRRLPQDEADRFAHFRRLGYVLLATSQLCGGLLLYTGDEEGAFGKQGTYAGLILSWVTPVVALQWCVGAEALIENAVPIAEVLAFGAVNLVCMDRWAIRNGIWWISEEQSFPPWMSELVLGKDMPVEEASFFLLSSTMCVLGLTLAVATSIECRRVKRENPEQSVFSCFGLALSAVHNWGIDPQDEVAAFSTQKTISMAKMRIDGGAGKQSSSTTSSLKSNVFALFEIVAHYGVPLAMITNWPVAVVTMFNFVLSTVGNSPATATAVSIALVEQLRAVRAVQFLVTCAVGCMYLRNLSKPGAFSNLAKLATTNIAFAVSAPAGLAMCAVAGMSSFLGRAAPTA